MKQTMSWLQINVISSSVSLIYYVDLETPGREFEQRASILSTNSQSIWQDEWDMDPFYNPFINIS